MKPQSIANVLGQNKFYVVPDYQRDYSWGKTDVLNLWNDIMDLCGQSNRNHFLGAIVTAKYNKADSYLTVLKPETYSLDSENVVHLLDGQQRLTSLSMLLAAFNDIVKSDSGISDSKRTSLSDRIRPYLFDIDYEDQAEAAPPKLFLKEDSGRCFYQNALHLTNAGGRPNGRYKSVKSIKNHLALYSQLIQEWNDATDPDTRERKYEQLFVAITTHLYLVEVECTGKINEFQVFESLNGKGVNLTAIDRIKSIYLSLARRDNDSGISNWQSLYSELDIARDTNKVDNKLLHFFISLFFSLDGKRINKHELPDRFKTMANEYNLSFQEFDSKLQDAAKTYGAIRNATTGDMQTDAILKEIKELGQEQIYVPLYAASTAFPYNSDAFRKIADKLLVYSVRFSICGKPTNILDGEFAKMISLMRVNHDLSKTLAYIESRTSQDDIFRDSFARFSTTNSSFAKYLLKKIEREMRIAEGNNNPVPDDPTLEHIIPQQLNFIDWFGRDSMPETAVLDSFKEDYITRIGNMVLLNQSNNSKASNKDYQSKRSVYLNGAGGANPEKPANTYILVSQLVKDYDETFGINEIDDRSKKLADYAVKIWHG